jgi:peptidyl-prolyl cis-trans isomerase SurA
MLRFSQVFLGLLASFSVSMVPLYASQSLDKIVAIANDGVITEKQVEERLVLVRQQAMQHNNAASMPDERALREMVIDDLIKTELEIQLVRQAGSRIPEAEIERIVMQMAQEQGVSLSKPEEKEQFKQEFLLHQMRYQMGLNREMKITPEDIQAEIRTLPAELQKETPTQYRIETLLIPKQPLTSSTSSFSLFSYLHNFFARIFNKEGAGSTSQYAKLVAEKALIKAKQGISFAQLVSEVRHKPRWRTHDLGWRTSAQLPSFYVEALKQLKPGEVAGPFEAPNGIHLIRLVQKRGEPTRYMTHVRHIVLMSSGPKEDAEIEKKLNTLRNACLKKANFEQQAKQYSEDPESAFKGGDLGWVLPNTLGALFDAQIDNLIPGQISKPFKTDKGWHIIQIVERQPLTPAHPQWKEHVARKLITQRRMIEAIENWRKELYSRSYIQRMDTPELQ